MDLEEACDKVNKEALWQVLRMYDVVGKLLNDIMSVKSLGCARIKECENECLRIDNGVKQVCIMSPWVFNVDMDKVMK